jgi:2-oxoglutarate ferredoxin oxidoreductase subunit beta
VDDLTTYAENTWCPGCGNFGIFNAFKSAVRAIEEKGTTRDEIAISAGIGCHAKIHDYLKLSGLYSIHGRSAAAVQGMKLANPNLKVIAFAGDGDAFGEGLAHLVFAAKRNADMTLIVHDNGVYGLTTGQYTPTSEKGFRGPSTPGGSVEEPLNPITFMLEAGATFVARGYSGKINELADVMVRAVEHEGFAFIDVLQPCVTFNDTYARYNDLVEIMDRPAENYDKAVRLARKTDKLPVGVFYEIKKPPYHRSLYGESVPVFERIPRDERLNRISALLKP